MRPEQFRSGWRSGPFLGGSTAFPKPNTRCLTEIPYAIGNRTGGLITGVIGLLIQPWRLLENAAVYIETWLIGYSLLLGACGGVLIADYWALRRTRLDLAGLYRRAGPYWYAGGFNPLALIALAAGIVPCLPGFAASAQLVEVPEFWSDLYAYAWFVSFGVSFVSYLVLMRLFGGRAPEH